MMISQNKEKLILILKKTIINGKTNNCNIKIITKFDIIFEKTNLVNETGDKIILSMILLLISAENDWKIVVVEPKREEIQKIPEIFCFKLINSDSKEKINMINIINVKKSISNMFFFVLKNKFKLNNINFIIFP